MVAGIRHLLSYLRSTLDQQRVFYHTSRPTPDLVALTDAEFASHTDNYHNLGGHFIYYGPTLVAAKTTMQSTVATSPPES